jgi:hypothetical protein
MQVAFGTQNLKLSDGTERDIPSTLRTQCKEHLFRKYATERQSESGKNWFNKGETDAFRYEGVSRDVFLETCTASAKGELKQLGALDQSRR